MTLRKWYRAARRDLPWRNEFSSPWGVLVSEVMLQQTPVRRVLPVFLEWLRRWPNPAALAADSPGEAVRSWGRLGYPRRALRLHAAAVAIDRDHDGEVPRSVDALLALPGIGEYTARAVAAFAFGARVPVIDTNVRRVVHRVVHGSDDAGPATAADRALLEPLLPRSAPAAAELSIALMELGALVCTASSPKCTECPIRRHCRWIAAGSPTSTVRRAGQPWAGTDRMVRGRIMALLRAGDATGVELDVIRTAWPDDEQRERCLDSLIADGLAVRRGATHLALPR